jgi:hypothetical protein
VTFSDQLALLGVVIGLVAAAAGVVAAVYALKAYRSSERAGSAADRRYELQVEPRVQLQFPVAQSSVDGSFSGRISNAGGAAKSYFVLLNESNGLHRVRGSVPEHASVAVQFEALGFIVASVPFNAAVVTVAEDLEGRWWDCLTHTLVSDWPVWVEAHQELFDAGAFEYSGLPLVPGPNQTQM